MTTSRRDIFKLGAFGALGALGITSIAHAASPSFGPGILGGASPSTIPTNRMPVPFTTAFQRPPVILPYQTGTDAKGKYARYSLTQKLGTTQIAPGINTRIAGYNGMFPGPTIRGSQGIRSEVRIRNALPNAGLLHPAAFNTVTHLHGSASLPQYDGYANDHTEPGYYKTYHYPNWQQARTLWYHDHNHHVTAQNVYSGLAAFYPMGDPFEKAQLPQGEFDVPLMISDVFLNANGTLGYNDEMNGQLINDDNGDPVQQHLGLAGDIILVNGRPWPLMKVKPRIYRFRFLCASITRSYRFTLSTGEPLYMVGTDAGMMKTVQPVGSFRHGVAERYEVLIDFRNYSPGQTVDLLNLSNRNNIDYPNTDKIMRFEVQEDSGPASRITSIPTVLDTGPNPMAAFGGIDSENLTAAQVTQKRTLVLGRQGGQFAINGKTWADVEASNFNMVASNPNPYEVEEWTLRNSAGGWYHLLHIHLIDGATITRNTPTGSAFPWERGPKDVWYLGEGEEVTVRMQFTTGGGNSGGRYMVHCHVLPHEDADMMTQFGVGDYRNVNNPITADPARRDTLPANFYVPRYAVGYPLGH